MTFIPTSTGETRLMHGKEIVFAFKGIIHFPKGQLVQDENGNSYFIAGDSVLGHCIHANGAQRSKYPCLFYTLLPDG